MASPIAVIRFWVRTVRSGLRAPNEKKTCWPGSGTRAPTARDRNNSSAPATVYGGSVQATSNPSATPPRQRVLAQVVLDELGRHAVAPGDLVGRPGPAPRDRCSAR